MSLPVDRRSLTGKAPPAERHVPLVVVGAGAAGTAAALEAAQAGLEVLLVDEHPVENDLMAMDVPLYFGGRMQPAVRNRALMLERVVETNPALAAAAEAGVDVQLGTCVWGAFLPGLTSRELESPLLGLADDRRSWLVGYDRLELPALPALERIHDLARDYVNFLHPVRKLVSKTRSGPRVTRRYDLAQTPFHRLLDSGPARAALTGRPDADFALIVSDTLYQDVIAHGLT